MNQANIKHYCGAILCQNDYISMRIISDELFARLVKELAKDEKVAIFQQLLLSPKAENKDEEKEAEEETPQGAEK